MLESTHIDLFARLLVYSLTLSRDIGHSRITHDKNHPSMLLFGKPLIQIVQSL